MSHVKYHSDVRQFGSWYEFLEFVKPDARLDPILQNRYLVTRECASRKEQDYQWYGSSNFQQAYDTALEGWIDGQDKAYKISKPLIEKMLSRIERPDIIYDHEGISIDMGRVAAEDPG